MRPLSLFNLLAISTLVVPAQAATADTPPTLGQEQDGLAWETAFVEDTGAAERIEIADRLRTMSQEIPAAACHLHHGVDIEIAHARLAASIAEYNLELDALRYGNEALHIYGGEHRAQTKNVLDSIAAAWAPIAQDAALLLQDPSDAALAENVYTMSVGIYEQSNLLLSELEAEYTNPADLTMSAALQIEVGGRQSMYTQKIAYELCRVWSAEGTAAMEADLAKSMDFFQISIDALLHGMPSAGINPAPTPEIAAKLVKIQSNWDHIVYDIDTLVAADHSTVDRDLAIEAYDLLLAKMDQVDEVVHLLILASKQDL